MVIDGKTKLFLVIGDPIAQVKSPDLYTSWCLEHQVDAIFVPFQIAAPQAHGVLEALRHVPNLAGIVATIPFKPLVATCCDTLTPRAQIAGAANVVRIDGDQWYGDALDGVGCVTALHARQVAVAGASVQIIGAGGAGACVAAALADAGATRIIIDDLDQRRAQQLVDGLSRHFPALSSGCGRIPPQEVTIFVNASPCGMRETDPLPIDPVDLEGKILVEMIMQPARTNLFLAAQQHNCRVVPGLEVLRGQRDQTIAFFDLNERHHSMNLS